MCGIVGYVGERRAREIILAGLERLEYRGYDSGRRQIDCHEHVLESGAIDGVITGDHECRPLRSAKHAFRH